MPSPATVSLPAAFQVPRRCADGAGGLGPANRIERPSALPPEAGYVLYHRRYMVDKRTYGTHPGVLTTPPPLGTVADPVDPNAWNLVEVQDAEYDNLLFFTRTYGTIPQPWFSTSSSNVALPAFSDPETLAAAKTISAVTVNNAGDRQTLTSTAHGYSAGDILFLNLAFIGRVRGKNNDQYYHFTGNYPVLSVTTDAFDLNLGPIQGWKVTTPSPATAQKLTGYPLRTIVNRFVPTRVQHDYFLPGITRGIRSDADIPLLPPFTINRGTEADDFAANTLTALTIPTAAQYWSNIQTRTRLTLDCTLQPLLGPLLDRQTLTYAAQ